MPSLAEVLGDMFLSAEERKRREQEARYGKNRILPPEEAANLARETGTSLGGLNPYASANQSQAPQIMQDWQQRMAPQPKQPSYAAFLTPEMYQYSGGTAKSLSSAAFDPTQESLSDYYQDTKGKRIVPPGAVLHRRVLQQQAENFQDFRAQKNQEWDTYDPIARSQIRSMNKMADALQEAYNQGRLRDEEYFYAQAQLGQVAENYKWSSHTRVPGSQPGETVEQNGVVGFRQPDGSVKPDYYTAEHREKTKLPITNGEGKTVGWQILTGPGKEPEIVKLSEYEDFGTNIQAIQARREENEATQRALNYQIKQDKELAGLLGQEHNLQQSIENHIYSERLLDYINKRKNGEIPEDAPLPELRTPGLDQEISQGFSTADQALADALNGINQIDMEQKAAEVAEGPTTVSDRPTAAADPQTPEEAAMAVESQLQMDELLQLATTPEERVQVQVNNWRNSKELVDRAKKPEPIEKYRGPDEIPNGTVIELPTGVLAYVEDGNLYIMEGANALKLRGIKPTTGTKKQKPETLGGRVWR